MSDRLDVLVVEDSPTLARSLERQLRSVGDVRVAYAVDEALARLAERVPDVVMCDYMLGEETGTDLLEQLAVSHPGVRRVLYSGYELDRWQTLLDGGVLHAALSKPWSFEELLRAIGAPAPRQP